MRSERAFVLYWMIASRRVRDNFALDRAVALARQVDKPVLVLEALRCGYRHASDRLHHFVLDGMRDNQRALDGSGIGYLPYVEPAQGAGQGLLARLSRSACAVVTDEYPCFFLPRMVEAAADALDVRLEAVDSNGLLPMAAAEKPFARAHDFRRFLQRNLTAHLDERPATRLPAAGSVPRFSRLPGGILERWPRADEAWLGRAERDLSSLPIDHAVARADREGGSEAGLRALRTFLDDRLGGYDEARNQPDGEHTSGLSPYLHFGHVSAHRVLAELADREGWSPAWLGSRRDGGRSGWWGMSGSAEAFLDQLVTWRELGFGFARHRSDYAEYGALPAWARQTLHRHADDPRPHVYDLRAFDEARTHDELWNAAQRQLRAQGVIHNYLRMLWGKKILHWSEQPERALEIMIALNDRYALDGRDPNSYSGIGWVLGRFDRAWGPERPVFGTVRYMSTDSTRRKLRIGPYLERWGQPVA